MPKVLRIANRFNLGGPTYNVGILTKYLAPEFETLLIGGDKEESELSSKQILDDLGVEPRILNEMKREINPRYDYEAYKTIRKIIKEFKPDIVHTHASKAGAIGRMAALSCNVPFIAHTFHGHVFHSYFGKFKTNFYINIERYLANRSDKIIAISEIQKHEISEIYKICPPSKVEVIPLGFDLSRFRENVVEKRIQFRTDYEIEDDEIAIGIVGRIVPVKNHELFIRAVKYVSEKSGRKIRAFIVGDGEDRLKAESIARSLGVSFTDWTKDRRKAVLTFTSWIKNVDYVNAGMDIIALTSFNEGTPVSLIEAQAAGKPIVSTNVGGIENVVKPDVTSILSDISDIDSFYNNLLSLVVNDKMREKMGSEGWNHVKDKFHYTRLVSDTSILYNSLLNGK